MDTITIKVSDLFAMASELRKDKMDYVTLTLFEAYTSDGDNIPPRVEFEGFQKSDPEMGTDYDDIEAVPANEFDPGFGMTTNIH